MGEDTTAVGGRRRCAPLQPQTREGTRAPQGRERGPLPARPTRRERGRLGEELARAELERRGYRILAANARTAAGEVDLVALDGSTLCFVEVRLRAQSRFGSALESVDARKQRRVVRVARELLAARRWPAHSALRFDVVAIELRGAARELSLVRGAFGADLR
jgi:putative endonuclease